MESTRYINPTPSFIDYQRVCDWKTGEILNKQIYKIVFLNIYNEKTKIYDKYYANYFSIMIDLMNGLYNGINNHQVIGIEPLIRDINEMIQYVIEHHNDDEIIAYLGTSSYLF